MKLFQCLFLLFNEFMLMFIRIPLLIAFLIFTWDTVGTTGGAIEIKSYFFFIISHKYMPCIIKIIWLNVIVYLRHLVRYLSMHTARYITILYYIACNEKSVKYSLILRILSLTTLLNTFSNRLCVYVCGNFNVKFNFMLL